MSPPPEIPGYSDLVEVARGGFSVVYRGVQDRHDRPVAIKVLSVGALDDAARRRFDRECRAMGRLSWHPNVVALHDSGVADDGSPYLVMEYLEAGSLGDRLSQGPLPWAEAVDAGVQVAGALDAAHAAGALHRDVKPANLLLGPYGDVRLGDFGIASLEGSARSTGSHTSFTMDHVSPEVLRGEAPDERSDVYGLASSVYTLASGRPPFAGDGEEAVAALVLRVLDAEVPVLDSAPAALSALLADAMAKDPTARPQTAAELGRRLQEVQSANGLAVTTLRLAPGRGDQGGVPPTATSGDAPVTAPDPAPTVVAPSIARVAAPDAEPRPHGGDPDATIVVARHAAEPQGPAAVDPPPSRRRWNLWAVALAGTGVSAVLAWWGIWFTDSSPCCSGIGRGDFDHLADLARLGLGLGIVAVAFSRRRAPMWARILAGLLAVGVLVAWWSVVSEFRDDVLPFYEPDDGERIGWGAWVSALVPLTVLPGLVLLGLDIRRSRSPE